MFEYTREIIALLGVLGFIVACFMDSFLGTTGAAVLKDVCLIIVSFYFGNKSALDNVSSTFDCPYYPETTVKTVDTGEEKTNE